MMKKHRFEKYFQSVLGNHIDADNSEALPNREEIDNNVEKILKMLRTEESGAISSENSLDKSELASLIVDFHKGYQAVYGRYDHLMGKLKKRIQPTSSDNGRFSIDCTSSDSEDTESGSEEFSDKKEKLNQAQESKAEHVCSEDENLLGQLENMKIKNNELETMAIQVSAKLKEEQTLSAELAESAKLLRVEMNVLREELEASLEKEDAANQKMRSLYQENESLRSENAEAFSRIHDADKSIEESHIELNQIKDEAESVKSENSILKEELEKKSNEVTSLNLQLISVSEEKESLRSGNFVFLRRIQEAEKALAAFRDQADQKLKSRSANLSSENESLKLRLEAAARQETDMTQILSAAEEEIDSLKSEILRSSSLIQEAEKTIGDLTTESGLLRDENLKLLNINNDLDQQLKVKIVENEALTSERLEVVEVIRKAEEKTSMLSVEIETLKDENSKLLVDYEKMRRELEAINDKISELRLTLKSTEDEKQSLALENSALLKKIKKAEKAIDDLKADTVQQGNEKSQLEFKINDLGLELSAVEEENNTLALKISGVMMKLQQAESNGKELENELEHLREEISMLQHDQMKVQEAEKIIEDLKSEVEQLRDDNSKLKNSVSNLGLELEASNLQLTDLNKTPLTAGEGKTSLNSEIVTMKGALHQAELNVQKLEAQLGRLQEENAKLKVKLGEKEKERSKLEESCKELLEKLELSEARKADEDRENAKLNKKVQTLEVHLRLSNQKLKITETENKDKEEGYMRTMEAMKDERRVVEEQMLRLSTKTSFLGNEVRQVKDVAEAGISGLAKGYRELESVFEENSGHILKQLSTYSEELRELKKWITKLKNEKQELSVRLKYKEGIMSMMKDESESIGDKLIKKEKELAVLRANAMESEGRMRVLEEMLREKNKEVSEKDEAKREAIRQLCLLIEYQRENCDHLCKYLSSVLKSSGQSS